MEAIFSSHPSSPSHSRCSRRYPQRTEPSDERRRNSRSLSPSRHCFRQPPNPQVSSSRAVASPKHCHKQSSSDPAGTSSFKSMCPKCLGRHPHQVHECNEPNLSDGSPAYAFRNSDNRLTDGKGNVLCSDWQRPNGCSLPHKSAKHECSGCGNASHGAQKCHRAQACPSANTV